MPIIETADRKFEVGFINHVNEYILFYQMHHTLCEEIAGLKKRVHMVTDKYEEYFIGRHNFQYAIRRLWGFIVNNIHYIPSRDDRTKFIKKVEDLETRYYDDKEYHEYVAREKIALQNNSVVDMPVQKKVDYNLRYFQYIVDCFALSFDFFTALQATLMISPMVFGRTVAWASDNTFFQELAAYRAQVSNNISNFGFFRTIEHFKFVLSYHYTYRVFMNKSDIFYTDKLIALTFGYINTPEIIDLMSLPTNTSEDKNAEIRTASVFLRKLLMRIYILTNESLSDRRILPKVKRQIFVDRTLI